MKYLSERKYQRRMRCLQCAELFDRNHTDTIDQRICNPCWFREAGYTDVPV